MFVLLERLCPALLDWVLAKTGMAREGQLSDQPDNPDALHLLGLLASQTGRHEEAARLLERAVELNPSQAIYHGNLGFAYLNWGHY